MTATTLAAQVDVRSIPPRERHPLIFSSFRGLRPKETLELVNDHDPKPLYYQFRAELAGAFTWTYVEEGPEVWRVHITKLGDPVGDGRCCGNCGCA